MLVVLYLGLIRDGPANIQEHGLRIEQMGCQDPTGVGGRWSFSVSSWFF